MLRIDRDGVFPHQTIEEMESRGIIRCASPLQSDQFQPASLDLRLGSRAFRIRASFLSGRNLPVRERVEEFQMHEMDLSEGAVLEKGCVYLIPLQESLRLPADVQAAANAKSSTGRLDLLTRLITDGGSEFDQIEAGYDGPLYAEICPRSFSVLVRTGSRLNQIRFRRGEPSLNDQELAALHASAAIVSGTPIIDGGLGFSADLDRNDMHVGFRAKPHTAIIDIDRVNSYRVDDYWEPVYASAQRMILDPETFYVLVSKETVSIPPDHAAEMLPFIANIGEFRVHYAGFFDPGFGYSSDGSVKSRGVLEVRCHDVPFVLEHGQQVGRLKFERMAAPPISHYGAQRNSNYQGQDLKLSKHFLNSSL
ncbi:MAG: 2'-deoxycytidine 5'-triphosphate deaminase [Rhodobacteraceae bacterium]|nr:2'-deoxycytidine 5'-triphosphate deaminase [Paracoccaceae bacterium]